ncbi:MAG: hypothetical protein PHU56_03395 [Candidatus Pacebacteria bacterium]|nr:hypothetical protein [Candidatus Paceibacterota bacterium]
MNEKEAEPFIRGDDNKLPKRERAGRGGADSKVSRINRAELPPFASKEYDALQRGHSLSVEQVKDVLNRYREDTQEAITLLKDNPNPLKEKIILKTDRKNEKWSLAYIVVPQGGVLRENESGIVCAEGQDYIAGETYEDVRGYSPKDDIIVLSGLTFSINTSNLERLSGYINRELNTNFVLLPLNVKPKIDRQGKIVYMYITDLSADLYISYVKPSMKW